MTVSLNPALRKVVEPSEKSVLASVPSYATSVLEINLETIRQNYLALTKLQRKGTIAPVLKLNAYGLGVEQIIQPLLKCDATHFFVSNLQEGISLRKLVKKGKIYVLNGLLKGTFSLLKEYQLIPCVIHLGQIEDMQKEVRQCGEKYPIVLHLDSGFTRTGLSIEDTQCLKKDKTCLEGLDVQGVMSHLAFSKFPGHWKNSEQLKVFKKMVFGLPAGFRSLANSGGMSFGASYTFDLSRPGKAMYGVGCTQKIKMVQSINLSARFIQIQHVPPGYTVGYDGAFVTARKSILGTLGIGHGDSWFKGMKNRGVAYVNGYRVPFVGLVSMDLTVVDLTDMLEEDRPKVGDWAELIGTHLNMDEVARISVTTVHKIMTSLGDRHYRHYHPCVEKET